MQDVVLMQLLQKAFAEYNVNEWEQVIESLAALQNHRIPREKELLAKKMLLRIRLPRKTQRDSLQQAQLLGTGTENTRAK